MRRNIEEVINLVEDKDTPVEVAVDEGFEELFVSSEIGMKVDIFSLFSAVCDGQIWAYWEHFLVVLILRNWYWPQSSFGSD